MICPKCNAELKDGAKFCHVCGWKSEEPMAQQPQPNYPPQGAYQQPFQQDILPPAENELTDTYPSFMDRVMGILLRPKEEWAKIRLERPDISKISLNYALILILVGTVAAFVGYGFIGVKVLWTRFHSVDLGLYYALVYLLSTAISVFVTAFVIDILAPSFGGKKDFARAFQLVVYAYIPSFVGAIFSIVPSLSIIASLIGIYSLYHLCVGLSYTMFPPRDKKTGYIIVSLVVMVVVTFLMSWLLGLVLTGLNPLTF